MDTQQRPTIY